MFHKIADMGSPILMQTCATGKTIPKAKFEFMRAHGDGKPVKYFEVELENVLVGQITPNIEQARGCQKTFCLKFSKVKWRYSQQKIGGGTGGSTLGGWDLNQNRIAC